MDISKRELPVSVLEMKAVQLALNGFLHRIMGESLVLISTSATVVVYLCKSRGDSISRHM